MGRVNTVRQTIKRLSYTGRYFPGPQNLVFMCVEGKEGTSSNTARRQARIYVLLNIEQLLHFDILRIISPYKANLK